MTAQGPVPLVGEAPAKPACYDLLLPGPKLAWDTHDRLCASFADLWLGHKGGVSCFGEQSECDGCGHTFHNEGLMGQYGPEWSEGDPILQTDDGYEARYCACCGDKARAAAASQPQAG